MTEDYPIFYNDTVSKWNDIYCTFPKSFSPKVILDIGAYDGTFAVRCKEEWPKCKIFSLEIDSQNIIEYQEKTKSYSDCHIIEGYFGYYNKNYFNVLEPSRFDCSVSWFPVGRESGIIDQQTKRYTFSDLFTYINEEIDVVKINCCGAEFDLLKNQQELKLLQDVKYICGATWGGKIRNNHLENKMRERSLSEFIFTNLLSESLKDTHDVFSTIKDWKGLFWCAKKDFDLSRRLHKIHANYEHSGPHDPFKRIEMGLE